MSVRREVITASPAVGATGVGDATVSASSGNIQGTIYAVYLEYLLTPPGATTDVTLVEAMTPGQTILSITDGATDGWRQPMAQANLNTTGANITNQGAPITIAYADYCSGQ
jgi:hypothetical protein